MAKLTISDWTGGATRQEHARLVLGSELWRSYFVWLFIFPILMIGTLLAPEPGMFQCIAAIWATTMIAAAVFTGVSGAADRRRLALKTKAMMDLPVSVTQIPVEVAYGAGNCTYGSDVGTVTFTPGMIHFHGSQSRFSLPMSDVDPVCWTSSTMGYLMSAVVDLTEPDPVAWMGGAGRYSHMALFDLSVGERRIDLKALDRIEGVGKGFSNRFLSAAKENRRFSPPEDAEFVFPPLGPFCEGPRHPWLRWLPALIFAMICLPVLMKAATWLIDAQTPDALLAAFAVMGCALLMPVVLICAAASRAKRIGRLSRHAADALTAQQRLLPEIAASVPALLRTAGTEPVEEGQVKT